MEQAKEGGGNNQITHFHKIITALSSNLFYLVSPSFIMKISFLYTLLPKKYKCPFLPKLLFNYHHTAQDQSRAAICNIPWNFDKQYHAWTKKQKQWEEM